MKLITKYEHFIGNDIDFKELEEILLNEAGDKVQEVYEEDLDELINRGVFYSDDLVMKQVPMSPSKCHRNVAEFYQNWMDEHNSPDEIGLLTGWALSNDGIWRQHSWIILWYDDMIIETTEPRTWYYGIEKKGKDLGEFLFSNQ